MEHELLSLLKYLQLLDKINIELISQLEDGSTSSVLTHIDLNQYAANQLKKLLGQKAYYELLTAMQKQKEQYSLPPLTIKLQLTSFEQSDLLLSPPIITYNSFFDISKNAQILRVSATPPSNLAKFLEIAYTYDQTEDNQTEDDWTEDDWTEDDWTEGNQTKGNWNYVYTQCINQSVSIDIEVIPNQWVWFKQRWIGQATQSPWSATERVLTQRDELQPASPSLLDILRGFKTVTFILAQPLEPDFDRFVIDFTLDGNTYSYSFTNPVCHIDLAGQIADSNYQGSQVTFYIKQVDTSNNASDPLVVTVDLRDFQGIEPQLSNTINTQYQLQEYLNDVVNKLNATTAFAGVITDVRENMIRVSGIEPTQDMVGLQAIVVTNDATLPMQSYKIYRIIGVETIDDTQWFVLDQVVVQNINDAVYITGLLEATRIFQQQTEAGLETIAQHQSQHIVSGEIRNEEGSILYPTLLIDRYADFSNVRPGFIVLFENSAGDVVQTQQVSNVDISTHSIQLQKELDAFVITQITSYKIISPLNFTSTVLGNYFDKITMQAETVTFRSLVHTQVVNIDPKTGEIQLAEALPYGSNPNVIKLFDGQIVKFYDVVQYSDNVIHVEPDEILELFMIPTTRQEVFEMSDVLRSNLILAQNDISTSVYNLSANVYSKIEQTQDTIQLKVVNGNLVSSYFEINGNRIVLSQDTTVIKGDAIVEGEIDQSKVTIRSGQTILDADGIKIRSGDIKLGRVGTDTYRVEINNDGSGHVQAGKIAWNRDGSVNIDATDGSLSVNVSSFTIKNGEHTQSFTMDGSKFVFNQDNVMINGNQIVNGTLTLNQFASSDLDKLRYRVEITPNSHTIIRNRVSDTLYSVYPQTVSSKLRVIDTITNNEVLVDRVNINISGPSNSQVECQFDANEQTLQWLNLSKIQSTEVWQVTIANIGQTAYVYLNVINNEVGSIDLQLSPSKVFNTLIVDGENGLQYLNLGVNYIDITPVSTSAQLLSSLQGNLTEMWLMNVDASGFVPAPIEYRSDNIPRVVRLHWDDIKQYSHITIKYVLLLDGVNVYETQTDILNIRNYRLDVPLKVKLVQDNPVLSGSQTEAIVTALIYKNGKLVDDSELNNYIITFEPEGQAVYENGQVVPNKRKYTIIDVFKSLNVKCTVKSRFAG